MASNRIKMKIDYVVKDVEDEKRISGTSRTKEPVAVRKEFVVYNSGEEGDFCDCLSNTCAGCFFDCLKCSSNKCGNQCRVERPWKYDKVVELL